MRDEGPSLEQLLRRLSDAPAEFYDAASYASVTAVEADAPARGGKRKKTSAAAPGAAIDPTPLVCDLLRDVDPAAPPELDAAFLTALRGVSTELGRIAIVVWLLRDEWFLERPNLAPGMRRLVLDRALLNLTEYVRPESWALEPDRREELARVCMRSLGLRPRGETVAAAADRLNALDTIERTRVLRATAAAERRAREVREAMARQAALDAASRYGE